jgi:hypothetical protein
LPGRRITNTRVMTLIYRRTGRGIRADAGSVLTNEATEAQVAISNTSLSVLARIWHTDACPIVTRKTGSTGDGRTGYAGPGAITGIRARAQVTVVTSAPRRFWRGHTPRRRIARGDQTRIVRGANGRCPTDTLSSLTMITSRTWIAIVTGDPVGFVRIRADAG